jgi:hypothetical protein
VPGALAEVFSFFKRPENLERLTPPWLNFRILSSTDAEVREGTRIRYRLRLIVRRQLDGIFGIRQRTMAEVFGGAAQPVGRR